MARTRAGKRILRLSMTFIALAVIVGAAALGIYAFCTRYLTEHDAPPAQGRLDCVRANIQENYSTVMKSAQEMHEGELILVNNEIPYTFPGGETLVSVYDFKNQSYKVRDTNVALMEPVMEPLNRMLGDFADITGKRDVNIISGHRTEDYQTELYDRRAQEDGEAAAKLYVALPGGSEHHTGYALDFGIYHDTGVSETFRAQGEYGWLNLNAWRYGFVVRYDGKKTALTGIADEPWHLRYVGRPHAFAMAKKDYCLEEYIDFLKQFLCGQTHLAVTLAEGEKYEIYYVPQTGEQTEVPVPEGRAYTVSGNNVDGFIVTAVLEAGAQGE